MLDIHRIRKDPRAIRAALAKRNFDFDVEAFVALDADYRQLLHDVEELRRERNKISIEISRLGKDETLLAEAKRVSHALDEKENKLVQSDNALAALLSTLPNVPDESVPVGKDESANKVIREVGEKPKFDFVPKDYLELARSHDLIDTERASKVSGSRFGYLKREAALLEFALVRFAFDRLTKEGFIPVVPPVIIREEMMAAMGYLDSPGDREERYILEKDGLVFVGTSEQSLGPMHADEILDEDRLPLRYAGFSACFRREAGSYGKDTKGILRVHQFDKVEMFIFSTPERSKDEHTLMIRLEEELLQALKLSYRVVQLATGDLAQPSASTFDIEAWLPGQNDGKGQYRETHSSSNTTDFQARRLHVRVRRKNGEIGYVHTLNGTTFAVGRTIIAILENYQKKDGSIAVPKALQAYLGFTTIPQKPAEPPKRKARTGKK